MKTTSLPNIAEIAFKLALTLKIRHNFRLGSAVLYIAYYNILYIHEIIHFFYKIVMIYLMTQNS